MKCNNTLKIKNGGYNKNNDFNKEVLKASKLKGGIVSQYNNLKDNCEKILSKVSNYFDNNNVNNESINDKIKNIEEIVNVYDDNSELVDDIDIEVNIKEHIKENNIKEYNKNTESNDTKKDNLKNLISKITISESNGIVKEMEITYNELLVLKLAVLNNNNIINLMSKKTEIKNLINKGLLHLSENGDFVVVTEEVEAIIKNQNNKGSLTINYKEINWNFKLDNIEDEVTGENEYLRKAQDLTLNLVKNLNSEVKLFKKNLAFSLK